MRHDIDVLNPIEQPGWDESLPADGDASFFHTAAWARVLWETYHYRPLYFAVRDNGGLTALLPVMEVNSRLTGRRGVSLPFTDYCRPIRTNGTSAAEINDVVREYGRKRRWKYVECRGDCLSDAPAVTSFYRHALDLTTDSDALFARFKSTTRRNIRKARRQGVEVGVHQSLEAVRQYYRLHCITRKRHGLPPQPKTFFEKIHEHVISQDLGLVVLARHDGKPVAGSVFFRFHDQAIYKYGALDYAYQHLRPSDLVMWEGIRWHAEKGYRTLCFGRTKLDNVGLRRFKNQWGTTEEVVDYHRYDFRREAYVESRPDDGGGHGRLFGAMPIGLLRILGSLLYKHMG